MAKNINLILLFVSILAALYLVEMGFFLSKMRPYSMHSNITEERIAAAEKAGQPFDRRTRTQYFRQAVSDGQDLVPTGLSLRIMNDGLTGSLGDSKAGQILPLTGISNRPTLLCNETGEWLVFHSDAHGFRNPTYTHAYPQGADLLILGDSFAMGNCVPEDLGALLRSHGLETVNLGVNGFGPLMELAALREYGTLIRPKKVLWVYYEGNDLRNLAREKEIPLLLRYLEPDFSQNLPAQQSHIDALVDDQIAMRMARKYKRDKILLSWKSIIKLGGVRGVLEQFYRQYIEPLSWSWTIPEPDLTLLRQVLERAKADASNWDAQIYFVYLPQWERFAMPEVPRNGGPFKDDVLEIASEMDFVIIDFTDTIENSIDPLGYFPYGLDGHYLQHGYQQLADMIAQRLSMETDPGSKRPETDH